MIEITSAKVSRSRGENILSVTCNSTELLWPGMCLLGSFQGKGFAVSISSVETNRKKFTCEGKCIGFNCDVPFDISKLVGMLLCRAPSDSSDSF